MQSFLKTQDIYFLLILIPVIIFLILRAKNESILFMQKEYKILKNIIEKLASKNNLGSYPLTFTITTGSRTLWIAESLGICKSGSCSFIKRINPFVRYKGSYSVEINEAIRQSYLLDGIEACAFSNGQIEISRSSFRNNEKLHDYLAFVIGHEISHVLNEDSFFNSLKKNKEGEKLKYKKKKQLGYKFSRESESKADITSARMLLNAGYDSETAIKAHDFIAKKSGYGYVTTKNSTHPGFEERKENLRNFLDKHNKSENSDLKDEFTNGYWKYNRKENTLTFKIKK